MPGHEAELPHRVGLGDTIPLYVLRNPSSTEQQLRQG